MYANIKKLLTVKSNKKICYQSLIVMATLGLLSACATTPTQVKPTAKLMTSTPPTYYTVKKGDTLSYIATRFGLDYRKIAVINGLDSNYTIYAGQKLRLLEQTTHQNKPLMPKKVNNQQLPKIHPIVNPANHQNQHSQWQYPVQGTMIHPFNPKAGYHGAGIWLSSYIGTPVNASQSGVVVYAGNQLPEFGKMVLIVHQDKMLTAYTHLGTVNVKNNQVVHKGQLIGTVGYTNVVNQPAIQFQLRNRGVPINPIAYLKN